MLKAKQRHQEAKPSLKKNNKGVTLVEVLVAVAILVAVTVPLLNSFVSVAKVNAKSNRTQNATGVAQNIFEGIKQFGVKETYQECNPKNFDRSKFRIIPIDHSQNFGVSNLQTKYETSGDKVENYFQFDMTKISYGSGTYNARVKVQLNNKKFNSKTEADLDNVKLRYKKDYDVTITVYQGNGFEAKDQLTTFTGSVLDYDLLDYK